jgi:AcrR family transcriptional regulator
MREPATAPLPAGPARDRRTRRRDSTRRILLGAGRRLFGEKGLYESRVEEITGIADIGKGTLYLHYRSKEELIRAVVDAGYADLAAAVATRLAGETTLAGTAHGIVDAHVGFYDDNPDLLRIFHQARGMLAFNREEWRPLRHGLEAHLESLAAHLGATSEGRRLGPVARRELATLLFGAVSGTVSVLVATGGGGSPGRPSAAARRAFVALAQGFARPPVGGGAAPPRRGRRLRGGG